MTNAASLPNSRSRKGESVSDCAAGPVALIVDDEQTNRDILKNILNEHGYRTLEAHTGNDAILTIATHAVDLVLLDILMPGMDGFEVLRRLRSQASETELPVIMVTASSDSDQIVKAFELGANDYLTKPVDVAVTLARITTQMRLKNAQAALRESEERYSLAARGANDGLWDWNLVTGEIYYSPRWLAMLGLDESAEPEHATTDLWFRYIHPEDRLRFEMELDQHLSGETQHFEVELRMEHAEGGFHWMLCRGLAVRNSKGKALRMAGSLTDITEGKVADALTSLPNRVLLLERLKWCIERQQREAPEPFALLYLDLDNFKLVNDSLGHEAGDRLLVSFARRLEGCVRSKSSVVSRLGGDEFAVLLERIEGVDDAIAVAKRILQSISVPFSLGGVKEVYTTASIGISMGTERSCDAVDMLQEADTAMYEAKAQGHSLYRVFDPVMKEQVTARMEIEMELRNVVERDELVLHYQPIFQMATGRLAGLEALVRWNHPRLGMVAPASFIPVAEETGLIVPIGRWILEEACRQMRQWRREDPRFDDLTVNVNLSIKQLIDTDDFEEHLIQLLDETELPGRALMLEMTESAMIEQQEDAVAMLGRLRRLGVSVALDDFGTGYSSMTQLYRLPLDALKIDQSFINQIIPCIENRTIVRAIISLTNNLNLNVIAEGIETAQQKRLLASMGCRHAQGHFFSRALPPDQIAIGHWCPGPPLQSSTSP